MFLKLNKDKENQKTQHSSWLIAGPPIIPQNKSKQHAHSLLLNPSLQSKYKIMKLRRHSNLISVPKQTIQKQMKSTINAKKMPLYDNRERNKHKSCRSASNYYPDQQKGILQQSNFDRLKLEAKKLQQTDDNFCVMYKWKPATCKSVKNTYQTNNQENLSLHEQQMLRKMKKSNMRKVVKGRPQIKKLLQTNRQRILKQKTAGYTQFIFSQDHEYKPSIKSMEPSTEIKVQFRKSELNNYSTILHTIL